MIINTGGSAFPLELSDGYFEAGMTLRDYFAAKALQGMLSYNAKEIKIKDYAIDAYHFADVMLKEREKSDC